MLNENAIIALLKAQFPQHIGDDGAALEPISPAQEWVITQDILVEDVHFRRCYHDPASLAHKALHVNLSDLAAMGATPRYILLALAIPSSYANSIEAFLNHFSAACKVAQVEILGGDTTRSQHGLFISVTALGEVAKTQTTYRHSAQAENTLCVVGQLGYAHLGLTALEQHHAQLDDFKQAFLYPIARVAQGIWLSQQPAVTAMMDLSDGLYTDSKKMAQASQLGATLDVDQIAINEVFATACRQLSVDALSTQLIGGEDYGLLLAVETDQLAPLQRAFHHEFQEQIIAVGQLHAGQGLTITRQGQIIALPVTPFEHF